MLSSQNSDIHKNYKGVYICEDMVKLTPDKMNLDDGYTAPPTIFKNMGLYLGETFKNREGEKLMVKEKENGRWYVEIVK